MKLQPAKINEPMAERTNLIPTAMNELQIAYEDLLKAWSTLSQRLTPVLSEADGNKNPSPPVASGPVPLANNINDAVHVVRSVVNSITDHTQRLEL